MSRQVSLGSADDYQADEQAGVPGLTGDYQTDEQAGVARVSNQNEENKYDRENWHQNILKEQITKAIKLGSST